MSRSAPAPHSAPSPPRSWRPGSGDMFDGIADRYDLLNRLLSAGQDRRWRREMVRALHLSPGPRVLDLGTGTGEVAFEILRRVPQARVVGLDPSLRMLELARRKAAAAGLEDRLEWNVADALNLPYPEGAFEAVTMAFGIRNVPDRPRALKEMARVLAPGGRVAILELLEPRRGLLAPLARWYLRRLLPRIGAALSGAAEYRYLHSSMAAFPEPAGFAQTMQESGLAVSAVRPLSFGVVCLFVAGNSGPAARP